MVTALSQAREFVCPYCSLPLTTDEQRLSCTACRQVWPVLEDIPQFVQDFPYWGEMPKESLVRLLDLCKKVSYRDALMQHSDPAVRRAATMLLNLDRANWHFLVDLPAESTILDIGAGCGTISQALAKRFYKVFAVEPVKERTQFMKLRFQQEGISNISVIRGSIWTLPFADSCIDMIVLNGVLEWVAEGVLGNPQKIQEAALDRLFRCLRPGGYLYLGIENRMVLGYFYGYRDPHCGLPFVTVLPRKIADWYARKMGLGGYRAYLYSHRGYKKLLRKAGFTRIQTYVTIPSYNDPRYLVPIDTLVYSYFEANFLELPRHWYKKTLTRLTTALALSKYLQYSYVFLAKK